MIGVHNKLQKLETLVDQMGSRQIGPQQIGPLENVLRPLEACGAAYRAPGNCVRQIGLNPAEL